MGEQLDRWEDMEVGGKVGFTVICFLTCINLCISDGGNVWVWGTNEFGQVGAEDDFTMISKPSKLQILEDDG